MSREAIYLTAETPVASTVPEPWAKSPVPGLWHVKGMMLPAYIQHVSHRLLESGAADDEQDAIQKAVGIVRKWSRGIPVGGETKVGSKKNKHPGHIHPDVQAAAQKAMKEWDEKRARAHAQSEAREHSMQHEQSMDLAAVTGPYPYWSDVDPRRARPRKTRSDLPTHFESGKHTREDANAPTKSKDLTRGNGNDTVDRRKTSGTDPNEDLENDPRERSIGARDTAGHKNTFAGSDERADKSKKMFKNQVSGDDNWDAVSAKIWENPATWAAVSDRSDWFLSEDPDEADDYELARGEEDVAPVSTGVTQAEADRVTARNKKAASVANRTLRTREKAQQKKLQNQIGGFSNVMVQEMPYIRSTNLSGSEADWAALIDLTRQQDEEATTDLANDEDEYDDEDTTDLAVAADERKRALKAGKALPPLHGGKAGKARFPMTSKTLAQRAVRMVGLAKGDHKAIRKYIMHTARSSGWGDVIPDEWNEDGSVGGDDDKKDMSARHPHSPRVQVEREVQRIRNRARRRAAGMPEHGAELASDIDFEDEDDDKKKKALARRKREDGEGEQEMARQQPDDDEDDDDEDDDTGDGYARRQDNARSQNDDDDDDEDDDDDDEDDDTETDGEEDDDEGEDDEDTKSSRGYARKRRPGGRERRLAHRSGSDVKKDDLIPIVAIDRDEETPKKGKKETARHRLTPEQMQEGRAKAGIGK